MYPALACENNPTLVFDCERFEQVIVIKWNVDFSYFGRQDPGDDDCILQQGGCKIPLTDNGVHETDLSQCEGIGYCTVEYGQHEDDSCVASSTMNKLSIYVKIQVCISTNFIENCRLAFEELTSF